MKQRLNPNPVFFRQFPTFFHNFSPNLESKDILPLPRTYILLFAAFTFIRETLTSNIRPLLYSEYTRTKMTIIFICHVSRPQHKPI